MNALPAFMEVTGKNKQSPMYIKITTIASAMKESLWSFESLWKASLRNDKLEFR